ncbi:hypothetical protein VTN00DRAFT_10035 [Thermoascus crustaceus]|uniref:uncharacterized protein n=1 Tax=Thermoascus crustaceus TaxID=5088 RepID=UPI0037433243
MIGIGGCGAALATSGRIADRGRKTPTVILCGQTQEGASREEVEREERGLEDLDRRWRDEDGRLNKGGLWGGDGKGGDEDDELAAKQRDAASHHEPQVPMCTGTRESLQHFLWWLQYISVHHFGTPYFVELLSSVEQVSRPDNKCPRCSDDVCLAKTLVKAPLPGLSVRKQQIGAQDGGCDSADRESSMPGATQQRTAWQGGKPSAPVSGRRAVVGAAPGVRLSPTWGYLSTLERGANDGVCNGRGTENKSLRTNNTDRCQ